MIDRFYIIAIIVGVVGGAGVLYLYPTGQERLWGWFGIIGGIVIVAVAMYENKKKK